MQKERSFALGYSSSWKEAVLCGRKNVSPEGRQSGFQPCSATVLQHDLECTTNTLVTQFAINQNVYIWGSCLCWHLMRPWPLHAYVCTRDRWWERRGERKRERIESVVGFPKFVEIKKCLTYRFSTLLKNRKYTDKHNKNATEQGLSQLRDSCLT